MPNAICAPAQDLSIQRLTSLSDEPSLVSEWNALAGSNPFLSWHWQDCWWQHYGCGHQSGDNELCVVAIRKPDGQLIGVAPWYLESSFLKGRTIRFLGSGEVCSDYLTVLCHPEYQTAVTAALANWLLETSETHWDLLDFESIDAEDPALTALIGELELRGCQVSRRQADSCWRIALPDRWEDYLQALSKSRREKIRRSHRRMFDTGKAQLHHATNQNELDRGFAVLCELHQSRRLSLGQPGCFASPRFVTFHEATSRRLLETGQLRLSWITLEEVPAAVEYSFSGGDTIYYYQSGIEPEMAKLKPGWLSVTHSIRAAISQGFQYFDLLRGDEAYKASLGAQPRKMIDLQVANNHLPARARQQVRQGIWLAKAFAKNTWQRPVTSQVNSVPRA